MHIYYFKIVIFNHYLLQTFKPSKESGLLAFRYDVIVGFQINSENTNFAKKKFLTNLIMIILNKYCVHFQWAETLFAMALALG